MSKKVVIEAKTKIVLDVDNILLLDDIITDLYLESSNSRGDVLDF